MRTRILTICSLILSILLTNGAYANSTSNSFNLEYDGISTGSEELSSSGFTLQAGLTAIATNSESSGFELLTVNAFPVCGNGLVEAGEACDGSNFNGHSCSDYSFTGGSLSCSSDCKTISTSACTSASPGGSGSSGASGGVVLLIGDEGKVQKEPQEPSEPERPTEPTGPKIPEEPSEPPVIDELPDNSIFQTDGSTVYNAAGDVFKESRLNTGAQEYIKLLVEKLGVGRDDYDKVIDLGMIQDKPGEVIRRRGEPNAKIIAYFGDDIYVSRTVSRTVADKYGRFELKIPENLGLGVHFVRITEVLPNAVITKNLTYKFELIKSLQGIVFGQGEPVFYLFFSLTILTAILLVIFARRSDNEFK